MLRIFVLIAGLLPLAILTGGSFVTAWRADPPLNTVANTSQLDLSKVRSTADKAADEATAEAPGAAELAAMDVFGDSALPILDDAGDQFAPLVQGLQGLAGAREALRGYSELCAAQRATASTDERKRLEGERTRWTEYWAKHQKTLNGVSGADLLQEVIQARLQTLSRSLDAKQVLEDSERLFQAARFDKCQQALEKLLEPSNREALTEKDRQMAITLKARADFRWYWRNVPEADVPLRQRWKQLADLLRSSPDPADNDQAVDLARRRTEAAALARQIRIDDLFAKNHQRFRDLADECHRILLDDPAAKEQLRARVESWITSRLLEKPRLTTPVLLQEAWMTDGRYLQGVFKKVAGDDPQKSWYKFWGTLARYLADEPFENQIYRSELRADPAQRLDVRLTDEFNAQRRELLKDIGSKGRWESFAAQCESDQKQIEKYYQSRQKGQNGVSFKADADLARNVLAKWQLLEALFPQ